MSLESLANKIPVSIANKVEFFVPKTEWVGGVAARAMFDGLNLGLLGWEIRNDIMYNYLSLTGMAAVAFISGVNILLIHKKGN